MVHMHHVFLILSLQLKNQQNALLLSKHATTFLKSATCFGPAGSLSRVRYVTRKISLQNVLYILLYYVWLLDNDPPEPKHFEDMIGNWVYFLGFYICINIYK